MGGCSFVKTVLSSGCGLSLWMSDLRNPYLTHCGKEDHANGRPLDTMMRIVLNASLSIHSIVKIVVLGCGISLRFRVYAVYNPVSVENCTTMILVVCACGVAAAENLLDFGRISHELGQGCGEGYDDV